MTDPMLLELTSPEPARRTPRLRPLRLALLAAVLAALVVAGCGDDDDDGEAAPTEAPEAADDGAADGDAGNDASGTTDIDIVSVSDGFSPGSVTVAAGTEIVWTNTDGATHTVTAEGGAFDSGNLGGGEDFTFTPDTAGTISYFCAIHPSMTGEIVVS